MGYKDLTNQTFGGITALKRDVALSEQKHRGWWKCKCTYSLHCGSTVSCGCKSREYTPKKMKLVTDMALSLFLSAPRTVLPGGPACANAAVPCGPAIIYLVAVNVGIAEKQLLLIYSQTNPLVIKRNKLLKTFVSPKPMACRALTLVFTQKTNWFFLSNIMVSNIINMLNTSTEDISARDQEKVRYCQIHNIPLEIIPYTEFDNLPKIIDKLLEKYQIKGGS